MKRRKIWLGLSTAIFVSPQAAAADNVNLSPSIANSPPSIVLAQNQAKPSRMGGEGEGRAAPRRSKAGGEGETGHAGHKSGGEGEGGEGEGAGAANLEPSLRFYRDLQRLRGHLAVGAELVQEGKWKEAVVHFDHPEKEIYGKLRPHLKTYDVTPFQTSLQALSKAVKAKNKASYDVAFAAVEQRLADADARMKGKETNWPYFVTETVVETLRSAAEEYDEAVKGQRIRNVVEYQDARGFGKRKSCSGPLAMRCPRRVQALLKQSVPRWLI